MIDIMKYLTTMSENTVQNAEVEFIDKNLKISCNLFYSDALSWQKQQYDGKEK